jgi:hypothetical protein
VISVTHVTGIPQIGLTLYVMIIPGYIFVGSSEVILSPKDYGVILGKLLEFEKKVHASDIEIGNRCRVFIRWSFILIGVYRSFNSSLLIITTETVNS